jgi:O-antigen/teichoic acid export membrane protein
MVYFDRFLIGSLLTLSAVTYYVTPYEVLSRAQMLSHAVMGVLFPAMTAAIASDRQRLAVLYEQTAKILFLLMLPAMAAFFLLAPETLELWLGPHFSEVSTPVVQWLALGWLINTLARLPLTVLQSAGRPDLVAKSHLIELLPYALVLGVLTINFGIAGTAAAWFMRVLVDTLILNELARRKVPEISSTVLRTYTAILAVLTASAIAFFVTPLAGRGLLLLCVFGYALARGWPILRELLTTTGCAISATPLSRSTN